jgi:uncharacterized membrane protein HdeD (DUF308 family)
MRSLASRNAVGEDRAVSADQPAKGVAVNNEPVRSGEGWIAFAGIVLMIAGFLNFVWGIAAIDDSSFFTDEGRFILFDDLNTWGWFFLIVGVLQMAAAVSIWNRNAFGQIFGIFAASVNILVLLFTVNAYPFAAFMLFIIDLLVIYALTAYGGPERPARR